MMSIYPLNGIQLERFDCATTAAAVLWPLYGTACIGQHPQLRARGFGWSKVLLPACPFDSI